MSAEIEPESKEKKTHPGTVIGICSAVAAFALIAIPTWATNERINNRLEVAQDDMGNLLGTIALKNSRVVAPIVSLGDECSGGIVFVHPNIWGQGRVCTLVGQTTFAGEGGASPDRPCAGFDAAVDEALERKKYRKASEPGEAEYRYTPQEVPDVKPIDAYVAVDVQTASEYNAHNITSIPLAADECAATLTMHYTYFDNR